MTSTKPRANSAHRAALDAKIKTLMAWHFNPATGSQFWLDRAETLSFDPLTDVRGADDLLLFPDFSEDLRTVPVQQLLPRGLPAGDHRVYESGGTSGAPKRIIDLGFRTGLLEWAMGRLVANGLPSPAHWLHLGPTGPHVFGFDTASYARLGNGTYYTVDFDPRWVKKLVGAGQTEVVGQYVEHLLDQMHLILDSQPVRVLSTTPPLIEAICARPDLHKLVCAKIEALIWAGTSFSAESLRQTEEVFFPDAQVIGIYGNTLMGVAPQRPWGGADGCVFEPHPDSVLVELVDERGDLVDYGERGQVRLHLLTEEMFLPNVTERDTAIRVEPAAEGGADGLADIRTLSAVGDVRVVEGVY